MTPRLDAPIKATFSVTDTCPLACAQCYGECGTRVEPELSTQAWRDILDEADAAGVVACLIEGGEPLERPDILGLVSHASRRMMVWLRTHALDVDDERARAIDEAGAAVVLVDLFGASAATHDAASGVPGSFVRSLEGLRALRRREALSVVPLMILTRRNMAEAQGFLDLAGELGCPRAGILRLYPIGRARRNWTALAPSLDEMTGTLAGLRVPPGLDLMQSWHPRDKNCCWENAAIMADGRSVGCPYLRDVVHYGTLPDVTLLESWRNPLYRRLRASASGAAGCPDCAEHEGTRGGCRATAYAFTGDWDAPDPFCPVTNAGIDLRALPAR